MSEQLLSVLKHRLEEVADQDNPVVRRNALKEELQLYVLNFIYHHPRYNVWIMYGGSALRIIHDLDRMSVDLDFEVSHPVTEEFLKTLKGEIEEHFASVYGARAGFLEVKITNTRGVTLKFDIGESLPLGHHSKQVHVKIDLHHFAVPNTVTERRPINRGQLSFAILAYNLSGLMASKIAAIFLRGARGVGEAIYGEKGRDIYDLLWYMERRVMPDFDYLAAKGIDIHDLRALFDKLTLRMNAVSEENLRQDLSPLFTDRVRIENWLTNWRTSFLHFIGEYHIRTVETLDRILIDMDFYTDNYSFIYWYQTEEEGMARIICTVSDYWMEFREGDLHIKIEEHLNAKIQLSNRWAPGTAASERMKKYATLFHRKIEEYLKKTNRIMLGREIATKVVRMTAQNFNPREQIILNPSTLLTCAFEDLLK